MSKPIKDPFAFDQAKYDELVAKTADDRIVIIPIAHDVRKIKLADRPHFFTGANTIKDVPEGSAVGDRCTVTGAGPFKRTEFYNDIRFNPPAESDSVIFESCSFGDHCRAIATDVELKGITDSGTIYTLNAFLGPKPNSQDESSNVYIEMAANHIKDGTSIFTTGASSHSSIRDLIKERGGINPEDKPAITHALGELHSKADTLGWLSARERIVDDYNGNPLINDLEKMSGWELNKALKMAQQENLSSPTQAGQHLSESKILNPVLRGRIEMQTNSKSPQPEEVRAESFAVKMIKAAAEKEPKQDSEPSGPTPGQ